MLKETQEGTLIYVLVKPNAKKTEIEGVDTWKKRIRISVKAPPVKGKANRELVNFLQGLLNAEVILVRGETSREKELLIKGLKVEEVKRKLNL
ncbi:hypothetical protein PNA2_0260 [Pyrococcus sp. NA2]|uniref:DUF167 family protein n=1 Tax=Pyrococcus sp. (strain NA2) TaxID=342949 RepID=UPI000209AFD0|nr:DUF167 family protein [Pyrococcus sp. NA2]AEC51177.1 hypothetical protein PNA2_0260 [Pyrococcus sp. NA2]